MRQARPSRGRMREVRLAGGRPRPVAFGKRFCKRFGYPAPAVGSTRLAVSFEVMSP